MDLFDEFLRLTEKFRDENIEYALCGGLAMAVYAFPRATLDIDILIEPKTLERVKSIAGELGFSFDAGLMRFREGAVQIYRLTKPDPDSGETLALDMVLATPEIKETWETRRWISWDKGKIPVVSPEGLIRLKSMRMNGQDQDDIKHLKKIIDEEE
jgi:hypothetical protein